VRVIVTLRDDFLVRAKELLGLRERLTQGLEILTAPAREELVRILVEPARCAGYEFEDRELPIEMTEAVEGRGAAASRLHGCEIVGVAGQAVQAVEAKDLREYGRSRWSASPSRGRDDGAVDQSGAAVGARGVQAAGDKRRN
jgi:hypothetical protein